MFLKQDYLGCARNVPLDQFNPTDVLASHTPDETLSVICATCRSGSRVSNASEQFQHPGHLQHPGHRNVVNVEGGTSAWDRMPQRSEQNNST